MEDFNIETKYSGLFQTLHDAYLNSKGGEDFSSAINKNAEEDNPECYPDNCPQLTEIQQKIVNRLVSNPSASRKQLASLIGDITEDGIKYHLKKLQQTGVIARVGADNGCYWEVNQIVQQ